MNAQPSSTSDNQLLHLTRISSLALVINFAANPPSENLDGDGVIRGGFGASYVGLNPVGPFFWVLILWVPFFGS